MVKVILSNEGFLIENKVLFGSTEPNPKYINLTSTIGEDVTSTKAEFPIVDYPGEYDYKGVRIECLIGTKDQKLNYLLTINGKRTAIIQTPDILENDQVSGMDFRLYMDDAVAKKIDQLELEGRQIKLDRETGATEVEMKTEENQTVDIKVSNTKGEDVQVEVE